MKKLLTLLKRIRKWKISRYVTLFLIIGTVFAGGNYLLSSSHDAPLTIHTTQAVAQNAGRGGGAVAHACPYQADICRVVPGSTDSQTIQNGVQQLNPYNAPSSGGPAWLYHPVDNSAWLPNQGGRPVPWFFQTPLDPIAADGSFTRNTWFIILGVADSYIFVLILMNGLRILGGAVGYRYTEAIETLPKMVLVIVVAHLSLLFVAFWIALANNLTQFIYVTLATYASMHNLVPLYPKIDNLQFTFSSGLGGDWNQFDIFSLLQQALPKFIVWGLLQVVIVQVLIRLIGLLLAILFGGPLVMLGASPFEQGKKAMRGWFMTIITTSAAQPAQVAFLLIGGILAQSLYNHMHIVAHHIIYPHGVRIDIQTPLDSPDARKNLLNNTSNDPHTLAAIATILWIEAAVLWGTIKSVSLVNSAIANMGADAAQNLGGQASGLAWAASTARFAYDQGWDQFRTGLMT